MSDDDLEFVPIAIGRGSSRGRGRVLSHGVRDIIPGRGRAAHRAIVLNNVDIVPYCDKPPMLEFKLDNYMRSGNGSIFNISMDYLSKYNDYEYFMDKVIDAALQSPPLITDFTMNLKLLTLLKTHGNNIKQAMFKKLQATFEKNSVFMREEIDELTTQTRTRLDNLCNLMSQLYYRFRLNENTQQRYIVLEVPVIECMKYLLRAKGLNEFQSLFSVVAHNYSALCQNHSQAMNAFALEFRSTIVSHGVTTNSTYLAWMICILECMKQQGFNFQPDLKAFYQAKCGPKLQELAPSRRLIADMPDNVVNEQLDKFECTLEDYTHSIFLRKDRV